MPAQLFDAYLDAVCAGVLAERSRNRVRRELLDHLNCKTEDAVSEGMTEDAAAAAALESFGHNDEVRTQITRAHRRDNCLTVGKGIGIFTCAQLVFALLMVIQGLILIFDFGEEANIYLSGPLFLLLTALSLSAARRKRILVPLFPIPIALYQLINIFEGDPTFIILIPELLKGNLPGFFKDASYSKIRPTAASIGMMSAFVLLFVIACFLISASSFRLKSKRTQSDLALKSATRLVAVLMAIAAVSTVLSFGKFVFSQALPDQCMDACFIVPAADEAETQKILDFYRDKSCQDVYLLTDYLMYASDEPAYYVRYHHTFGDWDEIQTSIFCNRIETKKSDFETVSADEIPAPKRDLFYEASRCAEILTPKKETGFFVAIPVIDDSTRTNKAEIIPWPPEEDVHIFGNMYRHVYEVILKAPTSDEQHE